MKLFKKRPMVGVVIAIAIFYFIINGGPAEKPNDQDPNGLVSPIELNEMMSADLQLVDVRTPEEYAAGHLPGAININFYDDDFLTQVENLDKSKAVAVYCKVGGRSGQAYSKVKDLGFANHYDLDGGFIAWEKAGLEME